jgi:hypothetical protein
MRAYTESNSSTTAVDDNLISIHDEGAVYASNEEYAREIRKYRTEIPNMVFDVGLTGNQIALYAHIKRRAGAEGVASYDDSWSEQEERFS